MAKVQNRVYDNNISGNTWGILNDYRAGGNEIYNNTITGNTHGIYLTTGHTPIVYHNNIYGNALSYHAPDGIERELSYNGQGNYWGRTSTPGFVAGVDSTGWWLHDTYPYLVKNGWEHGYPPGKPTDDPTRPDGEIVINGFSKPGPTYTGNPLVAAYLIWADDPAPSYPPLYVRFSTTVAGIESATWQYVDPAELPYWPYAALILPVGDGEKTVYAQLKNKWDFTSTHLLTDKIILDQSPPVNYSITINGGAIATNSRTVTLNLYAEDPHSTVTYMRIRNENTGWPGWSPYVSGKKEWTLSANDGLKTVYVQYQNGVNLISAASAAITLQTSTPPWISPAVPNITTSEDISPLPVDLTLYEHDNEDVPAALTWSISGVDTTLYSAEITADKKLKITPVSNKNGSDVATLTLRDSAGLTASQNITIYITAVNDKPTITLTQPGMASGEIKTGNVPITWNTVDVDGDALAINIYYNLADGTWLTIATNQPNTGSYSWNTLTVRDDYRYKIRVECLETGTAEKYSDAKFSANYFTIDNGVLIITPLDATPPHLNPDTSEKNLLPFELSEPAFDVYVTVVEVMIGQVKLIGPLALDAGIHSVEWNGRNNAGSILPPDDFIFRVSGKERDLLQTSVTSPASSTFSIVSGTPRFVILGDSPDPFNPFIGEKNTIQYIIYSGGFQVYTTLKIMDEGGNIKATLLNNVLQNDMTNYPVEWDGADITENGIFSYVLSGTKAPSGELANPVTGVITVIGADKKVVQSGDVTVYARPGTADVTITTPVSIASDVTYALGSLNIAPPYTYPVSPFYEIVATTPPVLIPPIIIAISYPSYLAPDYLKLFKYNTATPGFIAVGRSIVDPLNHILYAEVDSLSLFVLMASSDITKPQVQNIVLTPQILNFTLTDESSGINVPSIRVIMDGAEITDRLTFSGATGDLTITVSGTYTFLPYPDTHTMTIIAQDRGGNETTKTVSFGSGYADAKVALKPESLNINPGVLTAYLKLPQPFGIPTTVEATLDGGALERWMIDEAGLPEEGLFGPVVVLKFRRQAIADALAQQGEVLDTEFILKGKFDDGTAPYGQPYDFEGKDSITKIVSEPAVSESAPVVTEPPPSDSGNNGNNKGGKKK